MQTQSTGLPLVWLQRSELERWESRQMQSSMHTTVTGRTYSARFLDSVEESRVDEKTLFKILNRIDHVDEPSCREASTTRSNVTRLMALALSTTRTL